MTTDEGVRLLLRGYNNHDVQQQHQDVASKITKRLGELALAIDQAAAYIKYRRISLDCLEDFLATYEAERKKILSYTPKNFWEYERNERINAFTTWELSFQQLVSEDEPWKKDAGHFLTISAFLAPTSISESIFRNYHKFTICEAWIEMFNKTNGIQDDGDDKDEEAEEAEEDEQDEDEDEDDEDVEKKINEADSQSSEVDCYMWDPDRFWEVITKLDELSLLQSISPGTGHEGANFSLHPLIRDGLQLRLKRNERANYTQEAIKVLSCCAEAYDDLPTSLAERTGLITHMDVSLSNDEQYSEPQDRLGRNIVNCNSTLWFATFYEKMGQYRASKDLHRRVLETRSIALGEKHPDTLRSMNHVACILNVLGDFKESERMHRQTLTLREKEWGNEDIDTLGSMNNLAVVLAEQGKYKEAELVHRRTLTLRETVLGKEHQDTLISMNNLAVALQDQHEYEEAEVMHRRELALSEKLLGKAHPSTLSSMNNLALALDYQEKYEEAESIYRETLTSYKTVSGKEHPKTLKVMHNLARSLEDQDRYEEAERLYRETLMLREMLLGKDHPDTLITMNNLAVTLDEQHRYEEAERLYRETLMLSEMMLGKDHHGTVSTRKNLAAVLSAQRKDEEAELMAAIETRKQSPSNTAAYPVDNSASSDAIDVARISLAGAQRGRQQAQSPKNPEGDKDDGVDGGGGEERERGRRRAWMSRWAKMTMNAMHHLQLGSQKDLDH